MAPALFQATLGVIRAPLGKNQGPLKSSFQKVSSKFPTNRNFSSFADNAEGVNPPHSVYRICNLCSDFSKKCGGFFGESSAFTCKMRRFFWLDLGPYGTEIFLCGNQKRSANTESEFLKRSAKTVSKFYQKGPQKRLFYFALLSVIHHHRLL